MLGQKEGEVINSFRGQYPYKCNQTQTLIILLTIEGAKLKVDSN
jgi:hypothetical protein